MHALVPRRIEKALGVACGQLVARRPHRQLLGPEQSSGAGALPPERTAPNSVTGIRPLRDNNIKYMTQALSRDRLKILGRFQIKVNQLTMFFHICQNALLDYEFG